MERVSVWRAMACAGMITAALVTASTAEAAGPQKAYSRSVTAQPTTLPAGAPLQFFTIAQRLTALRAAGELPAGPVEPQLIQASLPAAALAPVEPAPVLRGAVAPPAPADQLLGMVMLPVPGGELAEKWRGMAQRWAADASIVEACRLNPCQHEGAKRWISINAAAAEQTGRQQLALVHASLNRAIRYATDYQSSGSADYWASPLESVEKMGDCEDYAIAKYMMLRSLGYQPTDLKLIVLFQRNTGMFHAILAVRSEGDWVYLDNQRQELARAADYNDARPLAALDEGGQAMLALLPQPVLRLALLEPSERELATPDLP